MDKQFPSVPIATEKKVDAMRKENQSSSIPRLTRSASLRLRGEQRPTVLNIGGQKSHGGSSSIGGCRHFCRATPDTPDADDSLSTKSYGSCASFISCEIGTGHERGSLANGSNKTKYVLHCQRHIQTDTKYLTPTQRKDREIRQLKAALIRTSRSCEEKGIEIERLKSEVDRLRFSNSQSCTSLSQPSESPVVDFRESDFINTKTVAGKEEMILTNSINSNEGGKFLKHDDDQIRLEDSGILDDLDNSVIKRNLDSPPKRNFSFKTHHGCCKDASTQDSLGMAGEQTIAEESEETASTDLRSNSKETQTEFLTNQLLWGRSSLERGAKWYDEDPYRKENYLRSLSKLENSQFSYFDEENASLDACNSLKSRSSTQEYHQMKEKYNTKIENLLQKLSEQNLRYLELRNGYDKALERIRQLDSQGAELRREMAAQEEWHSQMYLKMYRKGQEAAKFEHADEVLEFAHRAPKRVSVPELLQQLHQTENELEETKQMYRCELYRQAAYSGGDRQAEYTLKFLKDAVYYYLTEKDNKGHLQAIESILGFSDGERITVAKAQRQKKI